MKIVPWLIAFLGLGVAVTLWLARPCGGKNEEAQRVGPDAETEALAQRVTSLEGKLAELTVKVEALPEGTAIVIPAPEPTPVVKVAARPEPEAQPQPAPSPMPVADVEANKVRSNRGPGEFEANEPFMRVGSREGFAEMTELVEELPEDAVRWGRGLGRVLELGDDETRALIEALSISVSPLQSIGRAYLEGKLDSDLMKRGFWSEWNAVDDRVASLLSAEQLARFQDLKAQALETHEFLPALVGRTPSP